MLLSQGGGEGFEVGAGHAEEGGAGGIGGAEAVGVEFADDGDAGFFGEERGDFGVGGGFEEESAGVFGADGFDDGGEFVNRVRADGTVERVNVVSGETEGDLVYVSGDLQPGDRVQLILPAERPDNGFPFGG